MRASERSRPLRAVLQAAREALAGRVIAALYVEKDGIYAGLPDIDVWDESRDARKYAGPHPVVAHPPCTRWCQLAGVVEARWGHKRGEDGGTFAAALAAVRAWGGVLEHPAYTMAWRAFGLPTPKRGGGWHGNDRLGYVTHVEQGQYGQLARKATWLYAFGVPDLPQLRWGVDPEPAKALVGWCMNHVGPNEIRPRVTKKAASATPLEFRDVLLSIARSVNKERM
jgi:hypothetical protein